MEDEHLVADLEWTCCNDGSIPPEESETIEIGAVVVANGSVVREFDVLVKPVLHPHLTKFCSELTGIRQEDIDVAVAFPEAWGRFIGWVGGKRELCSWGRCDLWQLAKDCRRRGLPTWFEYHCDLVETFGRRCGHRNAMRRLGLESHGRHHRGVDDAKNVAAVLIRMLQDGKKLRPTVVSYLLR